MNEKNRSNFRRPQPAIDQDIQQRDVDDVKRTRVTYDLLRNEKNKADLVWNPVLNAEIFKSKFS